MRIFLSNFKKKIILSLIPFLVRYRAFNLLSLLFALNLTKIKSILPKKEIIETVDLLKIIKIIETIFIEVVVVALVVVNLVKSH